MLVMRGLVLRLLSWRCSEFLNLGMGKICWENFTNFEERNKSLKNSFLIYLGDGNRSMLEVFLKGLDHDTQHSLFYSAHLGQISLHLRGGEDGQNSCIFN